MADNTKERDPRIAEAATRSSTHLAVQGKVFPNNGRLNVYQCNHDPGHVIVTVDREPGVTPFTVQCPICEATGCEAESGESLYRYPSMRSAFYRVDQSLTPTHEFYRPDTLEGMSPAVVEHVLKGGLLFRKIAQHKSEVRHV